METAIITRPSLINGRPFTRVIYIIRECTSYRGTAVGRPVVACNTPGGPAFIEVI